MFVAGTPDEIYRNLTEVLIKAGVDRGLAYNAVIATYKDPDQSDPSREYLPHGKRPHLTATHTKDSQAPNVICNVNSNPT